MMKKMLINAAHSDETRIALIDNQWLYDLEIENIDKEQKKGNIYKATVTKIEPSLDAVFVNYGNNKHGFLPFKEIAKEFLSTKMETTNESIKNSINKGDELIVQINKEERKKKGAALTTYISLAGCYLVLMPNNPKIEGISRHINGDERQELRKKLSNIKIPVGMGIIIRTAGIGKNVEELQCELNILTTQFENIRNLYKKKISPYLIYQEGNIVIRSIRDNLNSNIKEIIIDEPSLFKIICNYLNMIKFNFNGKVKLYNDNIPLFSKYKVEHQIELAFKRKIYLPSGGSIVIDNTEALVSIDVNSAKSKKGTDIEETALQTNLEAVNEIARQLRLRDLGGLIVIDFIDMNDSSNQRVIEKDLKVALSMDKAKIQLSKISRFGLLEMSRQRLRHSLIESNEYLCAHCNGLGKTHNIKIISSIILRALEEELANSYNICQINLELPIDIMTYIINIKRNILSNIEYRYNIIIQIIANKFLFTPEYKIYKIKSNNKKLKEEVCTHNSFKKKNLYTSFKEVKKEKTNLIKETLLVNDVIKFFWMFLSKKQKKLKIIN